MKQLFIVFTLGLLLGLMVVQSQELPRCEERQFILEFPRAISLFWCLERPLGVGDAGEWAYTALAFAADGSFYATRPQTGELLALRDTDGDTLPDRSEVLAAGMRLPNGLAVAGDTLYIIGDGAVYRYENGELSTIADDLPAGRGFMASAIAVYQQRIYLGIPFPCDFCEVDNELYGTILSMDLDGENREIVARGLRYPAGLLIHEGMVWVTDTGRDRFPDGVYDEINRFELDSGEIPHFGFPYCVGLDNAPDGASDFACTLAHRPQWGFYGGTTPFALERYESDTFPWLQNEMLVTLAGSFDNSFIRAYSMIGLRELSDELAEVEIILPADSAITPNQIDSSRGQTILIPGGGIVNQRGAGIWPHRIYDVAVSPEGWIYLSVGGAGIYVLRPGDYSKEEICQRWREC